MADIKLTMSEDDDQQKGAGAEEYVVTEINPATKESEDDRAKEDLEDHEEEGGTDDERAEIRERRRREKLERRERRDQAIKRDKTELDFLRKRNEDLEMRITAQEVRAHRADLESIESQIARAAKEAEMAEQVIAKAVAAGNGEDVTQAMRYRDQAMQRAQQLAAAKRQAEQAARQQAPGIDDSVMLHAREFMEENSWYDPQGRDEDSAIVLAVDQALVRDGYDPRSEEYWDELRRRASKRLPEKFGAKETKVDDRRPRGGPAVGSGKEHAPTTTRREVYISPERKQALMDAGVWDDPVLRTKYIKRYAEYDRVNRA